MHGECAVNGSQLVPLTSEKRSQACSKLIAAGVTGSGGGAEVGAGDVRHAAGCLGRSAGLRSIIRCVSGSSVRTTGVLLWCADFTMLRKRS